MSEPVIKKRSSILAALFSLLSPGMGHLYVGKWKLAVAIPFLLMLILAIIGWSGLIFMSYGMSLSLLLVVIGYFVVMVSAIIYARDVRSHQLNASQRWYYYLAFLLAMTVINSSLMGQRDRLFGFEPFRIPAASMLPTLLTNDFIIVDTSAYHAQPPQYGDLVVFDYPRDPEIKYIKRVIGKAGDHVAYTNKTLYINGKPLARETLDDYASPTVAKPLLHFHERIGEKHYQVTHDSTRPAIDFEYVIPDNSYFVMGDNRDNSNDSRYWGTVPHDYLHGRAEYIWLSIDENGSIRSERIGQRL